MYYYLGGIVCCGLLCVAAYYYRYLLLFLIIQFVVQTRQLYKRFKNRNITNNCLNFVTADKVSDNVIVCHYHGYIDQKEHKIKIIKNIKLIDGVGDMGPYHIQPIIESLDLRNHIVHCSLVTSDEKQMIDLTSVIREFVYHFDMDDDVSKMGHFFQYVNKCYDLDDSVEWMFVIYLNDDHLTEVKYKVKGITNNQFREVLKLKKE